MAIISHKELKALLFYDQNTGIFQWRVGRGSNIKAWQIAGCPQGGYIGITVKRKLYMAHRLAIYYMTGTMPPKDMCVHHKDYNKVNNKFSNLAVVTKSYNNWDRPISRGNSSGYVGVCYRKATSKWCAYMTYNKSRKNLGCFKDKEDAIKARRVAESKRRLPN